MFAQNHSADSSISASDIEERVRTLRKSGLQNDLLLNSVNRDRHEDGAHYKPDF
jgi:hypothetical protein